MYSKKVIFSLFTVPALGKQTTTKDRRNPTPHYKKKNPLKQALSHTADTYHEYLLL